MLGVTSQSRQSQPHNVTNKFLPPGQHQSQGQIKMQERVRQTNSSSVLELSLKLEPTNQRPVLPSCKMCKWQMCMAGKFKAQAWGKWGYGVCVGRCGVCGSVWGQMCRWGGGGGRQEGKARQGQKIGWEGWGR